MSTPTRELKPRRLSFMIPRIVTAMVVLSTLSVMILVGALLGEMLIAIALIPVVWVIFLVPAVLLSHVAYTKERYEIHADHLVCHRGSWMTDGSTELDVHNITHVRLRLPWIRHKLFGIGDVRVESAGSAAAEITFQSIVGPEEVFQEIQDLMRANGYSLQLGEVLHEESPGVVGALTYVAQAGIGALVASVFVLSGMAGVISDVAEGGAWMILAPILALGSVVAVLVSIVVLVVRYLDMTRRTYIVYDDAVVYTEGFLTRNNAIIPFENIADASANRTVVDQVLGLYDVKVSCQGSGSEVVFRRLARGEQLSQAIGTLVANASDKAHVQQERNATSPEADSAKADSPRRGKALPKRSRVDPSDAWTAELKMNTLRAQLPLLVMVPVIPLWLASAIATLVRTTNTTFTIGPNSASSSYSFLGATQQEFAYDKVTGVQVNRSPLDQLTHTLSVQLWSIGSSKPLNMQHIAADQLDLPALLRQCGIDASAPVQGELTQSFGPVVWAVQNVSWFVLIVMGLLATLVVSVFIGPLALLIVPLLLLLPLPMAAATFLRVKRQRVTFHAEHVEAQTGVFFRKHIYARYDNVKKVETVKIPLTDQGRLKLYIAGERVQQQQNGKQGGIKVPYSLEGAYIEGISRKADAVDALMLGVIEPSQINGEHAQDDDVVTVCKPAIPNAMVPVGVLGLFFPPLLLLLPIVAWRTAVASYTVETDRVVARGGILFKFSRSVLFDRIDSLQQNQGALGKAFGNGRITILTAGSSAPDLVIANIPDYQEVYGVIRHHYGKAVDGTP